MSTFLKTLGLAAAENETRRQRDEALQLQYEQFKARAEAAEQECARLRQEIGEVGAGLRQVLDGLRRSPGDPSSRLASGERADVR